MSAIRIAVPVLAGQIRPVQLNAELRAAGIMFDGCHNSGEAVVLCAAADEAAVRAIIAAHLSPAAAAARALNEKKDRIDAVAETVRAKYLPNVRAVEEYRDAEIQARDYKAAGYSGAVPAYVAHWAGVKGWSARQASDDIITAADFWRSKNDAIRRARLEGKAAIEAATKTVKEVEAELLAL